MTQAQDTGEGSDIVRVVAAVITAAGDLLVVRKHRTARFMLPGGKPHASEDDMSCLTRELSEELSVGFDKATATFLGCFTSAAANEPGRFVAARLYRINLDSPPQPGAEIAELLWLDAAGSTGETDLAPLVRERVLPLLRSTVARGKNVKDHQ